MMPSWYTERVPETALKQKQAAQAATAQYSCEPKWECDCRFRTKDWRCQRPGSCDFKCKIERYEVTLWTTEGPEDRIVVEGLGAALAARSEWTSGGPECWAEIKAL